MSIGIYKITSPTNKIYIGQSIDIEKRWEKDYKTLKCKGQRILYKSLKKYGWEQHKFEILEECKEEQLLERETYWKQCYQVLEKPSLCCRLDGKGGKLSEETKYKIKIALKNKPRPKELMQKLHKHNKGLKRTEETKRKISESNKGRKISKETKQKISKARQGVKMSESTKEKLKNRIPPNLGKKCSNEQKLKMSISAEKRGKTNFDKNIYVFYNEKLNKEFVGIQYDFYKKYNLKGRDVNAVIRKKQKSVRGWKLK